MIIFHDILDSWAPKEHCLYNQTIRNNREIYIQMSGRDPILFLLLKKV